MIYDEQFGDDGGCAAVAAPVYRRYPIGATADGSRLSIDPSAAIDIVIVC